MTFGIEALAGWEYVLLLVGAGSTVFAVGGALLVPWWLRRAPADTFLTDRRPEGWRRVVRLAVGGSLIVAGIAMLVLPGQGILTIVLGLWFLDVAVFRRLTDRVLREPYVRETLNRWRAGAGQPPFKWPDSAKGAED